MLQSRTNELVHEVSSPLPPTFNVDNQVIFSLFVGEKAIFSNFDLGRWWWRDAPTKL